MEKKLELTESVVTQAQRTIENKLKTLPFPTSPAGLFEPIRYALNTGGKRLRPTLTLLCAYGCGADMNEASDAAAAIEIFHNFTLLHDDVMDKADLRRGRPTVATKFGTEAAILSGDAMLTLSTEMISRYGMAMLSIFNRTAMEVYMGQQYDMDFEARDDVHESEYIEMIRLKTAVLLGCACQLGAMVAEKPGNALYDYGVKLGLGFQLMDDLLDSFGNTQVFGKEIGGDIKNRKKTWLLINAMQEAPVEVESVYNTKRDDALVNDIKDIYTRLNLPERCLALINRYSEEAIAALDGVDLNDEVRTYLYNLALKASERKI